MEENSSVVCLRLPSEIDKSLTNILRNGARRLLAQAVEMEAEVFLAAMRDPKLPDGRDRVVRHGHGSQCTIRMGIGPIEVGSVKIRDRSAAIDGARIRFCSAILLKWPPRTKSLDALLLVLYLRGHLDGRLPGGAGGACGQGRPVGAAICVYRGGRCLAAGPNERQCRMHAGADRCDAGGQEELVGFQVGVRERVQH